MIKIGYTHQESYETQLKESLAATIEKAGGLPSHYHSGDSILIKPNLITARPADACVNTHPLLVKAMIELLLDYGLKPVVGDSPATSMGSEVAKKIGLLDILEQYHIPFVDFTGERSPYEGYTGSHSFQFKQIGLSHAIFEYDHLLNMAKFKSHAQMGITLTTKNLFGCVSGHKKSQWHFHTGRDLDTFARLIIEISMLSKASFHVLDGIWGMEGNGPTNGTRVFSHFLMASDNSFALDRAVIDLIGMDYHQFPIQKIATELNLLGSKPEDYELIGEGYAQGLIKNFKVPGLKNIRFVSNPLLQKGIRLLMDKKMAVATQKCILCMKCLKQCPAKAISYEGCRQFEDIKVDRNHPSKIIIHHDECIRCCCCQEICPVGALALKDAPLSRFI